MISQTTKEEDAPKYWDLKKRHDAADWYASMKKEFDSLYENDVWDVIPENCTTHGELLNAFMLLRIKRDSMGEVTSYKSRFCIKGNEQTPGETDDYFSPVCSQKSKKTLSNHHPCSKNELGTSAN